MRSFRPFSVARAAALLIACLGAASGCAKTIGADCTTNVQCSSLGDRFCDIASPDGYCTVDGCDYQTCPDNANCVRFFTLQRGTPCNPATSAPCRPGEICACDTATADGTGCSVAYCASEKTERRWCMSPCGQSSDCRDSYACYHTGANGALAVPYRDQDGNLFSSPPQLSYCAPSPLVIGPVSGGS